MKSAEKAIEIQIRTTLQHAWAELSEKFADVVDAALKYGGGDEATRKILAETSEAVASVEESEGLLATLSQKFAKVATHLPPDVSTVMSLRNRIEAVHDLHNRQKNVLTQLLRDAVAAMKKERIRKVLFLMEYARDRGILVSMRQFADEARTQAEQVRLDLELRLNQEGVDHEVVLLEASSEERLRVTHRRYFEDLSQLASRAAS